LLLLRLDRLGYAGGPARPGGRGRKTRPAAFGGSRPGGRPPGVGNLPGIELSKMPHQPGPVTAVPRPTRLKLFSPREGSFSHASSICKHFGEVEKLMKRFSRTGTWLVAVVATALPARAAQVDKFLPNDSAMVLTLNVRQVVDSPLVKKYALEQIQSALKSNKELTDALGAVGLDPLKDVSTITAAGPELRTADKGLVVVHGKFDLAKFKAKADEVAKAKEPPLKIVKTGDYTLYEVHDPKERTN